MPRSDSGDVRLGGSVTLAPPMLPSHASFPVLARLGALRVTRQRSAQFGRIARTGAALVAAVGAAAGLTACAATEGPSVVTIPRDRYADAFQAALEVIRDEDMVTALRDRDGGVIETQPRRAAGVLEPWRTDNDSFAQAAENTLALRRRRVRIEFVSTDFAPPRVDPQAPLEGPDLLGGASTPGELRAPQGGTGPIEIRAWVTLDRADVPGLRRFTWTRRLTTVALDPRDPIDPREGVEASSAWTPSERDEAMERRLLGAIEQRLAPPEPAPPEPST